MKEQTDLFKLDASKPIVDTASLPKGVSDTPEPFQFMGDNIESIVSKNFKEAANSTGNVYATSSTTSLQPQFVSSSTKRRAYIGIDNGVSGSIGIIYDDGTYEFFVTPVLKAQDYTKAKKSVSRIQPLKLTSLLSKAGEGSMVMIERPMINSTRFNASMSAIRAFEATITILETLALPYQIEDSKSWQKALLPIGVTGDDLKSASKDIGNRLFPKTKDVKHSDCDGMLIAQYCKSKFR